MEDNNDKEQFDSLLGGTEELPYEVHVLKFAAARSKEIATMSECILNPCSSKLIFQRLPVHMRRRIMSHNSKRLPRRLRMAHDSQLQKSGLPLKQKRPSRKHRRRPGNLMIEYNRRQQNINWLETHIWHAKRFHMTKKWGYKLAEAPCDKAFRACYRAGSKHCLLQDMSYYLSVQLSGTIEELKAGFASITSPKCGLGIASQAFLSSKREGFAYIYNVNKYPFECAGAVSFFWKQSDNTDIHRCLWLFIHPSFYEEFLKIIQKCFNLKSKNTSHAATSDSKISKRRKLNNNQSETAEISNTDLNTAISINPLRMYVNENTIVLIELKNTVNRFRLTGPLSHAILSEALAPVLVEHDESMSSSNNKKMNWFDKFTQASKARIIHDTQSNFWTKMKNISSPAELPCHLIVGLNVKDPRTNLPNKRKKCLSGNGNNINQTDLVSMPEGLSCSSLWNVNIRDEVSKQKLSTLEVNKLIEKSNLVPGAASRLFSSIPGVPVILIQRPGSQNSHYKRIGYNSAWDVILPHGYSMPFWLSFVLRGARTGGLRETNKLAFENGQCISPPDTAASQEESINLSNTLRDKYFRLPPNKRVNYAKVSINSPFLCRWNELINDWKQSEMKDFFVLRDKIQLLSLQDMIKQKSIPPDFDWNQNCLIPVRLSTQGRGKLSDFSLVCLPNADDHSTKKSKDLVEPLKKDVNQKKRNVLRRDHQALLKRLRRRCVRARKKITEKSTKYVATPKQNNSVMIEEYLSKMRELWLPSNVSSVRYQCSRQVIGYCTNGDFSFTEAQSMGVGYVALSSLHSLLKINLSHKKCLVLTRSTRSRQYRFALLEVICN